MYIKVVPSYEEGYSMEEQRHGFRWLLLLVHTGRVAARSDHYNRHADAVRLGKLAADVLNIEFKGDA